MNIGFFTDTYFPQISGVATSIQTLKEELEDQGHRVFIFTTTDPRVLEQEKDIIRLPSIPFVSFKERRIVVRGMYHAYTQAKKYKLDIVHTHTEFAAGLLGKHIAKQLKIPAVHTYHTMYEDYLHYIAHGKLVKPNHVKQAVRAYTHHLSGIICPSQRVKDTLKGYGIEKPMAVIPTGINLKKFIVSDEKLHATIDLKKKFSLDKHDILLLSISRLSYEKNIQALIRGMRDIVQVNDRVKLLIGGYGPYQEELEHIVEDLSLQEYVKFIGKIDHEHVGAYYAAADYFVSASSSESQGLTYIEALAAGIPVIVKGNDYIDSLFDHPALGVTYQTDAEFSEVLLTYIAQDMCYDQWLQKEKLDKISSTHFGNKILEFYEEAQIYYKNHYVQKDFFSLEFFKFNKDDE